MATRTPKLRFSDAKTKRRKPSPAAPQKLQPNDVYAMVKRIPKGGVATYGQIAAHIGLPRHARHVGYALSAMPENIKIPWHRVINAQGRVSLRLKNWQSGSDDLQRILLEAEGVVFDSTGKIDLKRFGWKT